MVDAHIPAFPDRVAAAPDCNAIRTRFHTDREAALAAVDSLPADIICSGYQRPDFLRAWLHHSPHEPLFVTLSAPGRGPVLLPLERACGRIFCFVGGHHANANFPVGRAEDIAALAAAGETAIVAALRAGRSHGHAIALERQLPDYRGVRNPFVFEGSTVSPDPALSLSLEGGFDAVLSRHNAKKRRKRFRSQERALATIGGYRFVSSVAMEDIPETLDLYFTIKARQFEENGVHNDFADPHVRAFFTELFVEGARTEPRGRTLKTIEAEGKTIAIQGCSIHDGRITIEFCSYDPDYAKYVPGELLFYLAIREAAETGLDIFDFSVGDARHKRTWSEFEVWHRDTIIPLNMIGVLVGMMIRARNSAVRTIKRDPRMWKAAKVLRKHLPFIG